MYNFASRYLCDQSFVSCVFNHLVESDKHWLVLYLLRDLGTDYNDCSVNSRDETASDFWFFSVFRDKSDFRCITDDSYLTLRVWKALFAVHFSAFHLFISISASVRTIALRIWDCWED